jgi:hypothetical protein
MINAPIATTAFNQAGLDAVGTASGQLAARWAASTPDYDASAMTLTAAENEWRAMVGGTLQWRAFGTPELTDAAGAALEGAVAVLRFHPHAALRLRRLIAARHDDRSDGRAARPVPFYAAIRGGAPPAGLPTRETHPPLAPEGVLAGDTLTQGTLTFHDDLGLILDPVAVACLYRDLLRAFPALLRSGAGDAADLATGTAGGIGSVCALAGGIALHLVDLFGGPWADRPDRVGLQIGDGARLGAGPHDWSAGALRATAADAADLRFGFAREGTLGTAPLSPLALPAAFPVGSPEPSLGRQFFRVVAVHLALHLAGNRSAETIDEVEGADEPTRLEPAPLVRDGNAIEFLPDGLATTGAVSEMVVLGGPVLAVSPTIATDHAFPADHTERWPAAPAPSGTAEALSPEQSAQARSDGEAAFAGDGPDVVITWPAGALPREAHVRAFSRVDPGPATVPLAELDFARRGDGGAAVVGAGATTLLLRDPLRLGTRPRPAQLRLRFDLLVVTREAGGGAARLLGGLELPVTADGIVPPRPPQSNALDGVPLDRRGVAPAPLLGLPATSPATGSDPVLSALGEAAPREAPRFRTMARTESIVAGHDGGSPGTWTAVLTPGFLTGRSVRGDARLGNPGRDAGPEDHAPGLRVSGPLAADLARAALRRTHHLARRLPELDDGRWAEPAPGVGTLAGAVLQGVAETCESPELSLLPESVVQGLPEDWNALVSAIGSSLPSLPPPSAGDRWVAEVRREAFAAKHGRRDALWSWRWAIAHARRLIYVETPLLGPTGDSDGVDLLGLLAERLAAAPDLRVILALPKRIPFGPGYEAFAQRFYRLRNEAIEGLPASVRRRVVAYHPIGFPGRPEVVRGTVAVVDDVWALVGSSSLSRRGLTFDGSVDVVFTDRRLRDGASEAIRGLRRRSLARTLSLAPPDAGATAAAAWVRTRDPGAAFLLVKEIVSRGGDGLVEPLWPGLSDSVVLPLAREIADPDGRGFPVVLGSFADLLAELGPSGV